MPSQVIALCCMSRLSIYIMLYFHFVTPLVPSLSCVCWLRQTLHYVTLDDAQVAYCFGLFPVIVRYGDCCFSVASAILHGTLRPGPFTDVVTFMFSELIAAAQTCSSAGFEASSSVGWVPHQFGAAGVSASRCHRASHKQGTCSLC